MDETTAKSMLRTCGWLANEERWLQDAVLAKCRLREYSPSESAFRIDDEPGGMYGVVDGGFGIYVASGEEDVRICHIVHRGIWFGHGPALTKSTRTLAFRAVEPSHALHLPLPVIKAIIAERPEFLARLSKLSETNYSTVAPMVIGDLLISSGERRLAATLVRISSRSKEDIEAEPWPIRIAQSELGAMANVSRDRVNRVLARFEKRGWISVEFKCIRIRKPEELHFFAYNK